jgi:hypothetical protein
MNCHQDGVISNGITLKTPHGGKLGYPVNNDKWQWEGITQANWQRKELPGAASDWNLSQQFHHVHISGARTGRANCTDCHTAGFESANIKQGVRESCASCHSINYEIRAQKEGSAGCVSCHAQHGEEKDLRAALRRIQRGEVPAASPASQSKSADDDE